MKALLEPGGLKEKDVAEPAEKPLSLGCSNVMAKYTQKIIPNCSRPTLNKVIGCKVDFQSTIGSDGWKGYAGLVDLGYK